MTTRDKCIEMIKNVPNVNNLYDCKQLESFIKEVQEHIFKPCKDRGYYEFLTKEDPNE